MTQNPFQWQHPKAFEYNDTIRKRIIGYEHIFQLMADQVTVQAAPHNMLIVGAGGGQELVTMANACPQLQFTAVDPSSNMLELAKMRLAAEQITADVNYIADTLEQVPVTQSYALASCHLVLHFLTTVQKKSLIETIAAHVEEGATVFFSSINIEMNTARFEKILDAWGVAMLRNGVTEKQWHAFRASFGESCFPLPTEDMIALYEAAGFHEIELYYKAYAIEAYRMKK